MFLSIIIIVLSIILDQVTKIIAEKNLISGNEIIAIPNILGFSFVKNEGAAFGMFANNRWVFMIFSTVAIIIMLYILFSFKNKHILFNISISLLIGGGIGNMIDRISKGYVVDFFKFLFVKFAVFNVADCFVTIGAVLLGIYLIFFYDENEKKKSINSSSVNDTIEEKNSSYNTSEDESIKISSADNSDSESKND